MSLTSNSHGRRLLFRLCWAVSLALWAMERWWQVHRLGLGAGFDVGLYEQYGRSWGAGQVPYLEFHPEYPPGALSVFLAPWLGGGGRSYPQAFAIEMAMFDAVALLCVMAWSRRLHPSRPLWLLLLGVAYTTLTSLLFPVLYARFDLAPGALAVLATYLVYAPGCMALGAFVLGVAAAVKLWPLALAPLFCGIALRKRGLAAALGIGLAIIAGVLAPAVGILPYAGTRVLEFLEYHSARGIQIESTWATVTLLLHSLNLVTAQPVHEYGAFHVRGPLGDFFAGASMKATVLLALAPQVAVFFRRPLGRSLDSRGHWGITAACASTLGFMVGGKVLSPQYMMWLIPLLVPCLRGPLGLAGGLAACVLTTVVYPYLSPALEMVSPGHGWALLAVGSRNALLFAFYSVFLAASARVYRARSPRASAAEVPVGSPFPRARRSWYWR